MKLRPYLQNYNRNCACKYECTLLREASLNKENCQWNGFIVRSVNTFNQIIMSMIKTINVVALNVDP